MKSVKNCEKLSKKQLNAIPMLLQGRSIAEGCRRAKISRQIFYSWYRDELFRAEFENQRKEIIELALHELKSSASEAVEVLRKLLKAESESVRLRTALGLLDQISKFIEFEELEKRLDLIERSLSHK